MTAAVQRFGACDHSGLPLHARSAVLVRQSRGAEVRWVALTGDMWDALADEMRLFADCAGIGLEVIDGRTLW